jgi:pimeloyl-ACP methyl ester carboxylesterase
VAEFTIERGGVRLAAEEVGEGKPVVLLHGLTATRRYVVMGSTALPRSGHRMLSYDARGHGRSSPAQGAQDYGYEQLGLDLEAVLDRAGIERAVLAGASMGAHTLLRLALARPDRVG